MACDSKRSGRRRREKQFRVRSRTRERCRGRVKVRVGEDDGIRVRAEVDIAKNGRDDERADDRVEVLNIVMQCEDADLLGRGGALVTHVGSDAP